MDSFLLTSLKSNRIWCSSYQTDSTNPLDWLSPTVYGTQSSHLACMYFSVSTNFLKALICQVMMLMGSSWFSSRGHHCCTVESNLEYLFSPPCLLHHFCFNSRPQFPKSAASRVAFSVPFTCSHPITSVPFANSNWSSWLINSFTIKCSCSLVDIIEQLHPRCSIFLDPINSSK